MLRVASRSISLVRRSLYQPARWIASTNQCHSAENTPAAAAEPSPIESSKPTNMEIYFNLLESMGHDATELQNLKKEWADLLNLTENPHLILSERDLDDLHMSREEAGQHFQKQYGSWRAFQQEIRDHKRLNIVRDYSAAYSEDDPKRKQHESVHVITEQAKQAFDPQANKQTDSENVRPSIDAPKELSILMRTLFSDLFKEEIYTLHKLNPERWTIERLSAKYRIPEIRVKAVLHNEKRVEEAEARNVGDFVQALMHFRGDLLQLDAATEEREDFEGKLVREFARRVSGEVASADEAEARRVMADRLARRKGVAKALVPPKPGDDYPNYQYEKGKFDREERYEGRGAAEHDEFVHDTILGDTVPSSPDFLTFDDSTMTLKDALSKFRMQQKRYQRRRTDQASSSGYLTDFSDTEDEDAPPLRSPTPNLASSDTPLMGKKVYVTSVHHKDYVAANGEKPDRFKPGMMVRESDGSTRPPTQEERIREYIRRKEAFQPKHEFKHLHDVLSGGTGKKGIEERKHGYMVHPVDRLQS
eukprot:TRINITY_DN16096_c0_g1::TRINITY_DN16096_c0_g1_i1::g.13786::m.13786 TRINITY_DN16096_c0_g1::TRINITY_DN16096_c0_g1_i1::g.13786  ORF type:complete len:533 (-),score=113.46,MRP-L20/PF12824.2/0.00013 TRINITY_DN16096_c0_g1_i1:183-1781(-)